MSDERRAPEEFLQTIERETAREARGRLKIFFGYAAGVGKTYAMLEAAHGAKAQGVDVVAGYIEPHTRPQTMALLADLEMLPSLEIKHRGIALREFNLDEALRRRPALILVDELAHANASDCRHIKRYQDIDELLRAGIDVYTTVNVQHIESLNDIVASITGVTVRERIPDHVFDAADQIELADIEPAELVSRLNEGKIYARTQAQKALDHFFTMENLTALREIALRRAADHLNRLTAKAPPSEAGDYHTDEHILVCLSSAPSNAKIIRAASRMAAAFRGRFTALFVETSAFRDMSEENRVRLQRNTRLAEQLGAKIETVSGDDVAFQIAEFSRLSGVSYIVIGRSNAKRRLLFPRATFAEQITAFAPNLDVHIIPDDKTKDYREDKVRRPESRASLADVAKSVAVLAASTLIGYGFKALGLGDANIITVYILGVLVTAVITSSRLYSLVSSVLTVLTFNFFFTFPYYTLMAYAPSYPVTFLVMFLAALITGNLATKIKQQARKSAQMAHRTKILLEADRLLEKAKNQDEIMCITANQLVQLLERTVVFYPVGEEGLLEPLVFPALNERAGQGSCTSENERAVAAWTYKNNKRAGASTETLCGAGLLYLAVRSVGGVYGVVGIQIGKDHLEPFESNLTLSMLGECALALEKDLFIRKERAAAVQAQKEQLRANLLRAISHDLRTPLTGISGNASMLLEKEQEFGLEKRHKLYEDIYDDSMWLINLVENLLSVTRIEDGSMQLNLEPELVGEVVDEALRHINRKSREHVVRVVPGDDMLLARMDARLMVQVVINIVDNAIKYTPPGSVIAVSAARKGGMVEVSIADNGPGIPEEAKKRLFDMFYTANTAVSDSRRGLGLGLALCKSIIDAHGGTIKVFDNQPTGCIFRFTLPAQEVDIHE